MINQFRKKVRFKVSLYLLLCLLHQGLCSKAQFAPAVGIAGTTAIYKDSSVFIDWANACDYTAGPQNIAQIQLGLASAGNALAATGKAGTNGTLSLGDGGNAVLTFAHPISNGPGYDFAVFENSFSDDFLEFAFVEVSSDGNLFFRFPATSNIQDSLQTGSFGTSDPTRVNNLAGKYRALYGTPFDLEELKNISGLNINNISHVKIIDVVGCIQNQYGTLDAQGHKINDPWPTPFASGGFDLDAVGVINQTPNSLPEPSSIRGLSIFPNPSSNNFTIKLQSQQNTYLQIIFCNAMGETIFNLSRELKIGDNFVNTDLSGFPAGIYCVYIKTTEGLICHKLIHN